MTKHRIPKIKFATIYPLYVQKAEKKGRTKDEVDEIVRWLTGYTQKGFEKQIKNEATMQEFFDNAPQLHPNRVLITGVVCGVRVEEVEDPLMREVRYLDKMIEELTRGKAMEKILRSE